MADLPGNTQYGSTAAPVTPKKQFPKLNINPGGSSRSSLPLPQQVKAPLTPTPTVPTNVPLGAPFSAKLSPVPQDYSSFQQAPTNPYERNAGLIAPQAPQIHQMPDPSMGQYVVDQKAPTALVKTNREFVTPDVKSKILGVLPGSLFQVDHVIPLWAGGADTPQNLQVLPLAEHEVKTKVQAVPLTLLSAGLISIGEAKVLAQNWKNQDSSIVPDMPTTGGNGLLDVEAAKKVYDTWKRQGQGYQTPSQVWNNFKKALPETVRDFGQGVLPNWLREPVKGFVSGATGGIVPYEPGTDETGVDKALGIGGVIAGSVWGIGKFARLLSPVLARTGLKVFQPTKVALADLSTTLARSQVVGKAVAPSLFKAAKEGGFAGVGKAALEGTKANLGNYMTYLRQNAAGNIIRNAAVLAPYGVATGAGRAFLSSDEENTLKDMSERLVLDVGLSAITGIAAPGLKGALPVAFGTYVLDSALGTPWRDSMLNAAVMGGLHGVGGLAPQKVNQAKLQEVVEEEATGAMQNVLHWWVPEVPEVTKGAKSAFSGLSTADDATRAAQIKTSEDWTNQALGKLMGLKDSISSDEFEMYRRQIVTAGHYLRQSALPPAEREAAMLADMASVFQQAKTKTFGIETPETVPDFLKAAGESRIFEPIQREPGIADTPTTGEIRIAGTGIVGINEQNMIKFDQAVKNGDASANLLIVNRPDTKALWELQSQNYTKKEIANLTHKPFQNPQNAAQVYGVVRTPDGGAQLMPLGWIPRRFTIDEKAASFNTQPEIVSGQFPRNNPERNKDSIVERMFKEDIPVLTMRLDKTVVKDPVKKGTRRSDQAGAYLIARLSEADWQFSKRTWDQHRAQVSQETPMEVVPPATGATTPDVQEGISGALGLASKEMKAQDVLANPLIAGTAKPGQVQVSGYLSSVDEAAGAAVTESEARTNLIRIGLAPETAQKIATGEPVTAKEVIGSVRRDNLIGDEAIRDTERLLGPNKSQWFKPGSPEEKWGDLPVATSRPARSAATEVAPGAEQAQGTLPLPTAKEVPSAAVSPESGPPPQSSGLAESIVARATRGDLPLRPAKTVPPTQPKEPAVIPTEAYQKTKQDLEMLSYRSGAQIDPVGLDSYTDDLIRTIKNSGTDSETQKLLAKDAMALVSRSRDVLTQEGVDPARSNAAWEKQIRGTGYDDIGKYIDAMRSRIANEFDIEVSKPSTPRTPETPEERVERVSSAIKKDAEPYLKMLPGWKNLSPLTYQYGHNMVFDTLAKNIWGANYQKNYDLMRFFSDKGKLGQALYHKGLTDTQGAPVRNKRGQEVGALFATETSEGRPISQPKDYVEARGVGDKAAAEMARTRRNQALAAARKRISLSQEEGSVAKPVDQRADVEEKTLVNEFRIEDPTQAASENIQDLTKYEASNLFGMLSGIEKGADPRLQPVRGAEDAATQIFNLIENWNAAVRNGYIKARPVRLSKVDLLTTLRQQLAKDTEGALVKERSSQQLKKELGELEKANEALRNVTVSPSRQSTIEQELASNESRIAEIKGLIGEPVTDGAGGPGYSEASPSVDFPQLASMDVGLTPAASYRTISPPPTSAIAPAPVAPALTSSAGLYTREQNAPATNPVIPNIRPLNLTAPAQAIVSSGTKIDTAKRALGSLVKTPQKAFQGLTEAVATGVDAAVGNKPIKYTKGQSEPSAIILGYDTTSYATDPAHAKKLNSIIQSLPAGANNSATIDNYIKSRFPKSPVTGQMVVTAAKKHGVKPEMMLAIMQNDSQFGTAGLGAKTRNPGNVGNTDSGATRTYKTWQAGVDAVASWLANHKVYAAER